MAKIEADPGRHGTGWRKKLAEHLGVSDSTLGKCRQFRRRYKKEDLPELEEQGVQWAHLSISFGIESKKDRFLILKRAKKYHWGERELQREIQRIKGACRGGGRPRKEPKSRGLLADVLELCSRAEAWNQFFQTVCAQSLADGADSVDARIDVDALRKQLKHAGEEVQTLHRESANAIKSIKGVVAKLPRESP